MQIETIIEVGGLVLVGAAVVRATMTGVMFAANRVGFGYRKRKHLQQFRATAGEHIRRVERARKQSLPAWEGKRKFQVVRRIYENVKGDICSFYITPLDGLPLPLYQPGQFLTLQFSMPGMNRCYSLSEAPAESQKFYRLTVNNLLAPAHAATGTPPGLTSSYLHGQLKEGAIVEAAAPAGAFCLDQSSNRPVVLIAGGVGLTPLLSMLNWLVATRSQRPIWVFYGVRNHSEHAFYDHLQTLHRDCPSMRLVVFYSRPTTACRMGVDYDVEGRISLEVLKAVLMARTCEFYICGPGPLMQTVTLGLFKWGVPQADIKFETFGQDSEGPRGPALKPMVPAGGEPQRNSSPTCQIRFARSKKTVTWGERDGTLLELAEACGVRARCSCRAGQCGACKVRLKHGAVAYLQDPLTMPEAGSCLLCITHPKTDLVLEL